MANQLAINKPGAVVELEMTKDSVSVRLVRAVIEVGAFELLVRKEVEN